MKLHNIVEKEHLDMRLDCNHTELYAETFVYITGNTQNNGAFHLSIQ